METTNNIEPLDYATYLADVLEASREEGREPGFFTTPEFAARRGIGRETARRRLLEMHHAGYIAPHRGRKKTLWNKWSVADGWLVTVAGRQLLDEAQGDGGVPA